MNLKLCPQIFRPAGCPLFLGTMVAVVMLWFLVVPVYTAACGRLELERSWKLVCPIEEVRQGTEDRPHLQVPGVPEGNPYSPSTSETTDKTPVSHGTQSVPIGELNIVALKPLTEGTV